VHVLRPASQNEAIPLTPIDRIFLFRSGADHQPRVRISGTVISANGSRVFIENGNTGVLVRTVDTAPVSPGDRVDAVGFPTAGGYSAEMDDAVLLPFGKGAGITPLQTTAGDLVARFRKPKPFLPDSMLIQLTATFLGASRSASGEVFTFKDGSTIFTASLQEAGARLRKIAEGSRLAVTGVCVIHADSFLLPQSFDLLLRSPADLQVLDEPSWLTRRLAMRAAGVLLGIALIALCAVMILGHRVGTQKTVIEEQKERERQLAERLRDLVENANDLVYILDLRGRILHVNSGAERVTGHSREEQLRMNITDLLVPEERELFRRELAARTSANGGYNFEPSEWCFLQKNGKTTCVELNLRIVAHAGDDVRIEAIGRDVTARKQALVDNEERFRTLANNIPQLTWMADETGSIFWCNERWFQYTGATLQESRGRGWEKWHHPEHLDRVRARLELCLQSGDDWEDTFPLRGRNGQFQWFLGRAVAIRNESGQVTRWFGTTTNISEQKRMEDHLKRSNDNLREFAYIASHDLQEPLRNVTLFAEMLAGTFKGGDATPQRATYLDVVTGGARRMKSLIADLLAYSTASGSDASDLSSIGFSSVIETAIQNLRTVIDESHARIVYGEMPSVRANSVHMAQVMQNLIANAIKYRRDGVPPVIKIRAEKKVDRWVFAVEDNGSGFKPEYGDRIFGIFKRLHGQDVPGTGIGLAICRALIERHGGKIWAEGRPGSGATFWFTIPD
jgi:PAS domain S-box-containing protein